MTLTEEQAKEISNSVHESRTYRVCTDLESILGTPFEVLDHGLIRVVDYMGGDSSIVQAARVSYGAGTKTSRDDQGLINYLVRNRHTTPLEMCEIKFHVKLPIFVARQWIRHRTANVNEYSARYSILDKEFYIPECEQLATQSTTNKQGRGEALDSSKAEDANGLIDKHSFESYGHYEWLLNECGVAREISRMVLPLNIYTQWYWKIDLHNLFHFLKLRTDSHAQWEIRQYANIMADIVKKWVPMAYSAYEEYVLNAKTFSKSEMNTIARMVEELAECTDPSVEQYNELLDKLGVIRD